MEECAYCHGLMKYWTVVCPHCGKINGHNK